MLTIERLVLGGRDVVAHHESFGEIFRAFEHGTCLRGSNNGNIGRLGVVLEFVVDALHQWVFGTYHHHVDSFSERECLQRLEVVGLDGHILTAIGRSSVAWGDEKFLNLLALRNLPRESMFATPAS